MPPVSLAAAAAVLALAVPLPAQQVTTAVSGEVRLRTEALRPAPTVEWDNFTLLRTRVGLLASPNDNIRAFVQLQDARVFGEAVSTMHGVSEALDLHQGYIELSGTLGELPLAVRAGRQEILVGNERLVGAVGWSNTGRSFDAARLSIGGKDQPWNAGAFLATVHEGGARFRHTHGHTLESDHWFSGIFAGSRVLEAHALYDRNAHFGPYSGVDRATLGGRLQTPAGAWFNASLEGAYQFGSQRASIGTGTIDQEIRAWFAGGRAGVGTGLPLLSSIGIGVDWLSGDDNALNGDYRAFNTLYATNHKFYGYMDLFLDPAARTGGRGLIDAMVSARTELGRLGTLELDLHRFQLANSSGISESEIGWELDLTYPFRIADIGRFMLGYSVFRNSAAAPAIGLGPDGKVWHWGFVQASVPF